MKRFQPGLLPDCYYAGLSVNVFRWNNMPGSPLQEFLYGKHWISHIGIFQTLFHAWFSLVIRIMDKSKPYITGELLKWNVPSSLTCFIINILIARHLYYSMWNSLWWWRRHLEYTKQLCLKSHIVPPFWRWIINCIWAICLDISSCDICSLVFLLRHIIINFNKIDCAIHQMINPTLKSKWRNINWYF